MSTKNAPAFPTITSEQKYSSTLGQYTQFGSSGGLTKREHFAGLALQGILHTPLTIRQMRDAGLDNDDVAKMYSSVAVRMADALLEALSK